MYSGGDASLRPTGTYIVKIVNTSAMATTARIILQGQTVSEATVAWLAADNAQDGNSITDRTNVVPISTALAPETNGVTLTLPANSLNIVRMR